MSRIKSLQHLISWAFSPTFWYLWGKLNFYLYHVFKRRNICFWHILQELTGTRKTSFIPWQSVEIRDFNWLFRLKWGLPLVQVRKSVKAKQDFFTLQMHRNKCLLLLKMYFFLFRSTCVYFGFSDLERKGAAPYPSLGIGKYLLMKCRKINKMTWTENCIIPTVRI